MASILLHQSPPLGMPQQWFSPIQWLPLNYRRSMNRRSLILMVRPCLGTRRLNRPFLSCLLPLCQMSLSAKPFIWKWVTNQAYFLMKGFARRLVLNQRHNLTRKWLNRTICILSVHIFVIFSPDVSLWKMIVLRTAYRNQIIFFLYR